jgi:hypothetical protein
MRKSNVWDTPVAINTGLWDDSGMDVGQDGTVYVAWGTGWGDGKIYLRQREWETGVWSPPMLVTDEFPALMNCSIDVSRSQLHIAVDGGGINHAWIGTGAVPPGSIGVAKSQMNGMTVRIESAVVTAGWPDIFYIEACDRSCGVRVRETGHGLMEGDRVDLSGIMRTNADGERYVQSEGASKSGSAWVEPLGTSSKGVGGGDWYYGELTGIGQKGLWNAIGLNNIGLLVRTWGRVTASGTDPRAAISWMYLDDGSNVQDGTGVAGVYCEAGFGVTPPTVGSYVSVTGISSCEFYNSHLVNVLRLRRQDDIAVISAPAPPAVSTYATGSQASVRPRDIGKVE